ncbi:SDR family oxidoreductase [Paenibacillus sp. GCM10023252]|uniref:SDR family oxidoreductase n=1 Tax=Paenibacillus sp. GCM10023252 TaxID=3252649 RepID=UPI00360D14DE
MSDTASPTILVTGATGNVGREVAQGLSELHIPYRAAVRSIAVNDRQPWQHQVVLDFLKPGTYDSALEGMKRIFLIRPPALADPEDFDRFLQAARRQGVEHVVFLSLLGAQTLFFVPHRKIEKKIVKASVPYTFLRPSFFMQNMNTTHREEIRDEHHIYVPAGNGKTSFIDVRDIAAVACRCLTEQGHENKSYDLTGAEALTYEEVARQMSDSWHTTITYDNPSSKQFKAYWLNKGLPEDQVKVMAGIYLTAKLGLAKKVTPELERLLGRPPITIRTYLEDYRSDFGFPR